MAKKPKAVRAAPETVSQSERFIAKAKELAVDETGETFGDVFSKVVPPRLPGKQLKPTPKGSTRK